MPVEKTAEEIKQVKTEVGNLIKQQTEFSKECIEMCQLRLNDHCNRLEKQIWNEFRERFDRTLKYITTISTISIALLGVIGFTSLRSCVDSSIQKSLDAFIETNLKNAQVQAKQMEILTATLKADWGKRTNDLLVEASRTGNEELVRSILDLGAADVNARDREGRSALLWAVAAGHDKISRLLIERKADVNSEADNKMTPLIYALMNNKKDIARQLLDKGANVNAMTAENLTPLIAAVRTEDYNIVNSILKGKPDLKTIWTENGNDALKEAVALDNPKITGLLLSSRGIDIHTPNSNGKTALILAAEKGNKEIIKMLLDKGANKKMALEWAEQNKKDDVIKILEQFK